MKKIKLDPVAEAETTFEDDVDPVMAPGNMTKAEAAQFLEELIDRCQCALDALRGEMRRR